MLSESELLEQAMQRPASERARIAAALLRSLDRDDDDDDKDEGAATAWDDEIARRSAEVTAGTADTVSLEDFDTLLRARQRTRAAASADKK